MTDAIPDSIRSATADEAAERAGDWSDYRKDYGVSSETNVMMREQKAFKSGWDAARIGTPHKTTPAADPFLVKGGLWQVFVDGPCEYPQEWQNLGHSEAVVIAHEFNETVAVPLMARARGYAPLIWAVPERMTDE